MADSTRPQVRTGNDPVAYTDVGTSANGGTPMPVTINEATYNSDDEMYVVLGGHISTGNSSVTPLGADAVFTGTAEDNTDNALVIINVFSNVASATDGVEFQVRLNGSSTWRTADSHTLPANTLKTWSFQTGGKDFRVKFTNGGTEQTTFELETMIKHSMSKPSSHRIKDTISDNDDGELTVSVVKLRTAQDDYVSMSSTNLGNAKISMEEYNGLIASFGLPVTDWFTEVARDQVTSKDAFIVNKFGAAPDFDTGDGEITIWDGAEDGAAFENMVYDYSATADIDSISSDNSGDTSLTMEIQGLDTNGDLVVQTATLDASDAQTRVALSTSLKRVFRVKNTSSTNLTGNVVVYPNTALTAGVPTDKSKVRAVVHAENNQTEMCIYTVPTGYSAYLYRIYADTAGASRSAEYLIKLRARPNGQVFQLKQKGIMVDDTSKVLDRRFDQPLKFSAGTDIEMTAEILTATITAANLIAGFDLVVIED